MIPVSFCRLILAEGRMNVNLQNVIAIFDIDPKGSQQLAGG